MPPLLLIGGIRGLIGAAIAAVIVWSALTLYDRVWDDPAVAAAAREHYVREAELIAAQAQLAEYRRQVEAGNEALAEARRMAEADAIADAESNRRMEQGIAEYEKRLAAAGKSCLIDNDALDFLLHN